MLALPFQRDHLVCYSKANYTVTNKPSEGVFLGALGDRLYIDTDKPSPGTPLRVPRDRLHKWQTSLPLVPISDYTRGQTTPRQMSFPLEPLSEYQETDYQGRPVLPWNLSQSTWGQTIHKENLLANLPLGLSQNTHGDRSSSQIYKQPFPGTHQGTDYTKT